MRWWSVLAMLTVVGCKKGGPDADDPSETGDPLATPFGEWTLVERTTVDGTEDLRDEAIYVSLNSGTFGLFWDRGTSIGECVNSGSLIPTETGLTLIGSSVEMTCSSHEIEKGEEWYGRWSGTTLELTIEWYEGSEPAFTPVTWILEPFE